MSEQTKHFRERMAFTGGVNLEQGRLMCDLIEEQERGLDTKGVLIKNLTDLIGVLDATIAELQKENP